ncbi:MAG: hypothetical protein R2733_00915 [Acidimicrobiales bacterium]
MTQTDVRMAWGKVGDRLSSLGLKLKLHAEQEFADDDDEVTGALDRLAEAIDDAVDMLTNAATDEAVQRDVRDAGRHFIDAVATTVNQATSQLRSKA